MLKNKLNEAERQEKTRELEKKLVKELWPMLMGLKQRVDRRLVKTCLGSVMAIVLHRHRNHGLLLSELSGYLLEPEHCQAGTKRIKPSYYNPPGGRQIFVPGFHWLQVLVLGHKGPSTLAHLHWWTTRSKAASQVRTEEAQTFDQIDQLWGKEVLHVWDRGFVGNPWLTQAFLRGARFILRWPKNYNLLDEQQQLRLPGEISKGKRSWDHRLLWDARHQCECKTGVIAFPAFDPLTSNPSG